MHCLWMLAFLISWPRLAEPQEPTPKTSKDLDATLQDHAFRAFHRRPRTGIPYDGVAPKNLNGIHISALRLRSDSLRRTGVEAYKEFKIPTGVLEAPYFERVALIYQNLSNWSTTYYALPDGYTYMAPVLGLLAYDATHLSAKNLDALELRAPIELIGIKFQLEGSVPNGSVARCVFFDLAGHIEFTNVVSNNTCCTFKQGHFSVVFNSTGPFPPLPETKMVHCVGPSGGGSSSKVPTTIGHVVGGLVLLFVLVF